MADINIENLTEKEQNELAKEELNAYQREWRKKHKSQVKEYNKRYYLKKALERKQKEAAEREEA